MTETEASNYNSEERLHEEQTTDNSGPAVLKQTKEKSEEVEEELPPLSYIDFLPQCSRSRLEGSDPVYDTFQSVLDQANQWLVSMPQFCVVKCETVDHQLNPTDFGLEADHCLQHFSSYGKNAYIKGLRLWLMPKSDSSIPVQQLGYITVLPDHSSGNLMTALSSVPVSSLHFNVEQTFTKFDSMPVTMEKLNHRLQQKLLPGRILTVETLSFKAVEFGHDEQLNTENTFWTVNGKASRLYLYVTRIFYVVGPPVFEKLSYHDEVPDCREVPYEYMERFKFAPYSQIVERAAVWLKGQQNMRPVNFQSVMFKFERPGGVGIFKVNSGIAGYTQTGYPELLESRYVQVLRIFYVENPKSDAASLMRSPCLTTCLFVPAKANGQRSCETFSKTVQRTITWLKATGTPVLGMETVRLPVKFTSDLDVSRDRVDYVFNTYWRWFSMVCIRLYFPCEFQEPPPEVLKETEEDGWGWACTIS